MTGNDALLTLIGELRLRIAALESENAQLRTEVTRSVEGTSEAFIDQFSPPEGGPL